MDVINFAEKLSLIEEHWSPKNVAQMNDYHFKVVKIGGEFIWHSHPETDETFIVLEGSFELQLREKTLTLHVGEMCVVPKGVEHRPVAAAECHLLLIEPAGTVNTGDVGGDRTAANDEWV
jgi:mannose-6-phosphate isomerase-like protein (cupin superfamily)